MPTDDQDAPGVPATVPADALIPASDLPHATGEQLDAALDAAGLPKTGKVDDKRERLSGYMSQGGHSEPGDAPEVADTPASASD